MHALLPHRLIIVCLLTVTAIPSAAQDGSSSLANKLRKLRQTRTTANTEASRTIGNPIYRQMLNSVALVELSTDDGDVHGTAWVVDAEQRLLVTNHHVIEGWLDCYVYFPEFVDGKLVTDPDTSLDSARSLHAEVIDSDKTVDLALIQLDDELPEGIVALELADRSATPGQEIHSIAGSTVGSQSLWIYSTGHVRQIVEGLLANDYEAVLLESDMATNQGNSGGPVCDDQGRVVAVVEGHRTDARLVSIYVDLQTLANYLSDAIRCVDPQTQEDLVFAAERHYEDARAVTAAKLVTKAIKIGPKTPELFTLRGWCWWALDRNDSATADFQEAVKLESTFAEAYAGLGSVDIEEERYEQAVRHMTDAIRNDAEVAWYYVDRGDARRELGQYEKAKRDYNAALDMDDEYLDAIRGVALCDMDLGNADEAISGLDQVIEEFIDDAETVFYGGLGLVHLEDNENALNLFARAIQLEPDYADAQYRLGTTLIELDRHAEAIAPLQRANELVPGDADVMFHYGIALVGNEQIPEGLEWIRKAHEQAPDNQDLREAYEYLREKFAAAGTSQPQPLEGESIPAKFVGLWKAQIRDQGADIRMALDLRSGGTYDMQLQVTEASGEVFNDEDNGTFRIDGDRLVYRSNVTGQTKSRNVRWQGQFLSLYAEPLGGWILYARSAQ